MEVYRTEEEQVEALKDWWKENGRSVIIGVVLALGGVFGWRYWQDTARNQAEQASMLYQQMLFQLERGDDRAVVESARTLQQQHGKTSYASLASLTLAQQAVDHDDLDGASAHLRSVIADGKPEELRGLARVRHARVLLAQGKTDAALQEAAAIKDNSYLSLAAEVKGDAHLARDERRQALQAYQEALAAADDASSRRSILQMKIDNLADAGVSNP